MCFIDYRNSILRRLNDVGGGILDMQAYMSIRESDFQKVYPLKIILHVFQKF